MEEKGIRKIWDILNPFVGSLLCMLGATMIGTMVFGLMTGIHGLNNEMLLELFPWLSLLITLIANGMILVFMRKSIQFDRIRFGFDRQDWKTAQYGCAAVLGAAAGHLWSTMIFMSGIQKIFTGYEDTISRAFEGQPLALVFLTRVIAAPIAEEMVFRFMIYRRARKYFGIPLAVVVSAVLFGIYHANVIQFVYAVGFTVLLILLYEKSGNILAPILAHAGANLWAIVLDEWLPAFSRDPYIPMFVAEVVITGVLAGFLFRKNAALH